MRVAAFQDPDRLREWLLFKLPCSTRAPIARDSGRRSNDDRPTPGTRERRSSPSLEGRRAEWIAFACLHSGVFIRDQRPRFLDEHPEQVRRGVHALIARGMAVNEMARIEEAILQGDGWVLGEYDGLQAAMKRSVALKKQARQPADRGLIHRGSTWETARLSGAPFR